jgi:hypothetical protein
MTIEAMKQVLKAWDAYDGGTLDHPMAAAMEALRAAIEQAERDWSLLEATQESLREHMAEIQRLKQRQWVGLTDEEINEIIGPWGETPIRGYTRRLFDEIEAKLKEKNR